MLCRRGNPTHFTHHSLMVSFQIPHPDVSWPIFTGKLPLPETSDLLFAAFPLQVAPQPPAGIQPLASVWGREPLPPRERETAGQGQLSATLHPFSRSQPCLEALFGSHPSSPGQGSWSSTGSSGIRVATPLFLLLEQVKPSGASRAGRK